MITRPSSAVAKAAAVVGVAVSAASAFGRDAGPAFAERLDQTAVGRFGAGLRITPNTASQSLLAWNVVCDGTFFEVRTFDRRGEPIGLGTFGLTTKPSKRVVTQVKGIDWTGLTCRMTRGGESVAIRESLLNPALWFSTNGTALRLFQPLPGRPAPVPGAMAVSLRGGLRSLPKGYLAGRDGRLSKPWISVVVRVGDTDTPVLAILEKNPKSVERLSDGSLLVRWSGKNNRLGLLPLNGSRPSGLAGAKTVWAHTAPADKLAEWFLWIPSKLQETYKLTGTGVAITHRVKLDPVKDEWGWYKRTKGYIPVPPVAANAKSYGYPVAYNRRVIDLGYPTYQSSFCVSPGSDQITYTLPKPDLYGTIVAPVADPSLDAVYSPEVAKTIREYSDYVIKTYEKKPNYVFATSAIGEARAMAAEYSCYRMMTPKAREVYDAWADQAAKDRIFNRAKFWGYGKDAASPRRFLIDNYRLGGNDFMDAGWFGYNIVTMWARAHFAGRKQDIVDNWPWIRESFYGWNWVYSDYAVGYSPLYVDGGAGGASKGYTDNMAMLPALYSWARMAEMVGDRKTLADALYMTARDRLGRFARMAAYDWARKCGYATESVFMVSDQGNGPDISPSMRFIPADGKEFLKGVTVDSPLYKSGLWVLTGSFLEPPSVETIDMVLAGRGMRERVADTVRVIDGRYPRWWAAPAASEMSNYLIFLRGTLFHEDPVRLRYTFDYQESLGSEIWGANAFHPYAFLGIALSQNMSLQEPRPTAKVWSASGWTEAGDEVEVGVLAGRDGFSYVTLWHNGPKRQTEVTLPAIHFNSKVRQWPGMLRDMRTNSVVEPSGARVLKIDLDPGLNIFRWEPARVEPAGNALSRVPKAVTVLNGREATFKVSIPADPMKARHIRLSSSELQIAGPEFDLPAGESREVEVKLQGPKECVAPYRVQLTVDLDGVIEHRSVEVLVLPSVVALLDLQGDSFLRSPQIGSGRVFANNRLDEAATLTFKWSYGDLGGEKVLDLPAKSTRTWVVPFEGNLAEPTRGTLKASVSTEALGVTEKTRRVTVLPPASAAGEPHRIVLYDFEDDSAAADGWYMPEWADGNKDGAGKPMKPNGAAGPASSGKRALEAPINIAADRPSAAFVGTPVGFDWRSFDTLEVDVYLPPDAPEGLELRYYLIGSDWQWREPNVRVRVKPGQWTTLRMPLKGPEGARMWKVDEKKLETIFSRVLDTGVKVTNLEPSFAGYRGTLRVDNVRVVGR